MKLCSRCKIEKPFDQYTTKKGGKFDLESRCICCRKELAAVRYEQKSDIIKAQTNAYKKANKKKIRESSRQYDKKHAEKIALRKANYRQRPEVKTRERIRQRNNKEYHRNYHVTKYNNDIQYRLKHVLRSRLSNFLRKSRINKKIGSAVKDLGCSIPEFIKYLETKFQTGMNWNNRELWEIDHIRPLSSFDLSNRDEFLKATHYTNLQPLWAEDNQKKNRKYLK